MSSGIPVRGWRIGSVEPSGRSCYFDPLTERVEIHPLSAREMSGRVDDTVSVSAPEEEEQSRSQIHMPFPKGTPHGS